MTGWKFGVLKSGGRPKHMEFRLHLILTRVASLPSSAIPMQRLDASPRIAVPPSATDMISKVAVIHNGKFKKLAIKALVTLERILILCRKTGSQKAD